MKIKAKLILGVGFLFGMIALLTTLSSFYINRLSNDTKNILTANYNTIDYSRQMLNALNDGIKNKNVADAFRRNIEKQKNNITEAGEKELTEKIVLHFENIMNTPNDTSLYKIIRKDITDIMLVNMQAIQRKSKIAEQTANSAILWIAITGTICFLIAFTLLINLPSNIANPIKELTKSIKEIAAQNYSERVHFEQHNEFGELAGAFNTMAEKLQEYKNSNLEKLMIEKKRIEALINNMSDPVIGVDDKDTILFINNRASNIAGLPQQGITGKSVQEIASQNDLIKTLIQDLTNVASNGKDKKTVPVKIYADGKESYFEKEIIPIKITPTGEKDEKHIGNVIILQNITLYKELDFAKTNFIATVSHELKTPISSIKMSLQLLQNQKIGNLNKEQENLIESIKEDTGRLLKITGELLNMTQVESGAIHINVNPTNINDIIEYAVNATKTSADQKQINISIVLQPDLPKVSADSEKTAWVLTNLLSNAIRYSYENSTIHVDVSEKKDKINFSVKDTGQGISPEYIARIFDRYFRIPGTKKEGTGLGLSISKEFIEAQGGTIDVKSDFGAGSIFTIQLNAAS